MAYQRSPRFNPGVDHDLLNLIEGFKYEPYGVRATSGYRPGDKRQHGGGTALDLELLDPKSGQALENYQDPSTFGAYQKYANALYQQAMTTNPDLAKRLRWGGYFSGPKGKYGALDLMHFDVGGGAMGGGSWEGGLTPEQAKLWGLQAGGGIGQDGAVPAGAADAVASQQYALPQDAPEAPSGERELSYQPSPVPEVANVQAQQVAPAQVSRGEAMPIADPRQQLDRRKLAMLLMGGQA